MPKRTRRDFLQATAGVAASGSLGMGGALWSPDALAQAWRPETNAKLRVLRWRRFVQGDEDAFLQHVKRFSEKTGVGVEVTSEGWEDVRPKAAAAAHHGSGPDIVYGWFDDPHLYPDKLVDLTDVANYLGEKYGGWYGACRSYSMRRNSWIGVPMGCVGFCIVHRQSHVQAAGFRTFPRDTADFLELCKALKAKGTPAGFALGNAVGDANSWAHWLVWSHGGRLVDPQNNVVINRPDTIRALEYGKALYETFIPGTLAWQDPDNNKAFLEGKISLTSNAISLYYAAKNSTDPKLKELADDIQHANMPIGPIGHATELNLFVQAMLFRYSKYPRAAKAFIAFMMEKEQYEPWQVASLGYITQPLRAYEHNTVWGTDPKNRPYRDAMRVMSYHGAAGQLGPASAAAMADYVIVNMVADAASGKLTPQQAAARAQERAERYYKARA